MQPRTGSVVEEASQKWGLLPCSACLASQLGRNSFRNDLQAASRVVLAEYFDVAPLASSFVETQASGNSLGSPHYRLSKFATELLYICHVD
eukprot:3442934-Karenia_brevis.AAC.1